METGEVFPEYKKLWTEKIYDASGLLITEKYRKLSYSTYGHPIHDNLFTEHNTYENGLLTVKDITRAEPPVKEQYVYTYANNKLTAKDYYFQYNGNYTLLHKYWYEYDTGDQPSRMLFNHYNFSYEPDLFEYTYDSRGNKIKEVINSDDFGGHPHSHQKGVYTWEYDSYNNLTKETFYADGTKTIRVIQAITYTYTKDGKIAEAIKDSGNGFYEKSVYHYDAKGYLEKLEIFNKDSRIFTEYVPSSIMEYEYVFRK